MARPEFLPFTAALNPFRTLERQIDRMFDEDFAAGAAGCITEIRSRPRRDAEGPEPGGVKSEG